MKFDVLKMHTFGSLGLATALALSSGGCTPGTDTGDAGDGDGGVVSCDAPPVLHESDVNGGVTLDGECYRVDAKLTISDGVLRIEPGVTITFGPNAGLAIRGSGALSAVGTEEEPILLTGSRAERGHWAGIHFVDSDSSDNVLEHVVLEHAGSSGWHGGVYSRAGIFSDSAATRFAIRHSTLRNNGQVAVSVVNANADITLEDVLFEANEAPAWLAPNLVRGLADLRFEENVNEYVLLAPNLPGSVDVAQTWPRLDVPYRVRQQIELNEKLTLAPGVEIRFEQEKGIDISDNGRLSAIGTEEEPITLRGVEANKGYWRGLRFKNSRSSDNVLEHVIFEDAGSDGWHGGAYSRAGIYLEGGGVALAVKNSTFRRNEQAALVADADDALLSVEGSTFEANDAPLWLQANLIGGVAADNTFIDENPIRVGVRSSTTVSTAQTWQAHAVPYRVEYTVSVRGALTLAPGITLGFVQNAGLDIDEGRLIADGREGERIRFIAAGGETLTGYWRGIRFGSSFSSENVVANADILYAGSNGWHGGNASRAALFVAGSTNRASVALHDVHIASSGAFGISVETESQVSPCENVTFADNVDADIQAAAGATVTCAGG